MRTYTHESMGAEVDSDIAKAITLLERAQTARAQGQERRAYWALHSAHKTLRTLTAASPRLVRCIPKSKENVDADMALRLLRFNDILADLEKRILAQVDRIESALFLTHKEPDPYLCDYNFDFSITFWLDDADPTCQDEDDNILAHFPYAGAIDFFCNTDNHNAFGGHPTLGGQHHCWLFHNLCCHANPAIALGDILRIGEIWVTFTMEPQFMVRIDPHTQTASSVCAEDVEQTGTLDQK